MDDTPSSGARTDTAQPRSGSPTQRARFVCQSCRSNKVRCVRETEDAPICNRCKRLSIPCHLPLNNKRRGRPPKSARIDSDTSYAGFERHSYDFSHSQLGMPLPQMPPRHSLPHYPRQSGSSDASRAERKPNADSFYAERGGPSHHREPYADELLPHARPRSPRALSSVNANLAVSDYLDPDDRVFRPGNGNTPTLPFFQNHPVPPNEGDRREYEERHSPVQSESDDPISLRMLSVAEAARLVELYHEHLNLLCAVLDSSLHTLAYLRSTSTLLFTSVLASSSKFFRKDLHPQLNSHAQTLLNRTIASTRVDLGTIQSLQLLTYFKSPQDTSAWMKIGMGIRLGYQFYMHLPRKRPLPQDPAAARRIINAERTWYLMFCFDRGYSQTFGLPPTIRNHHLGDPEVWAREHVHLRPTPDMHLACSIELCRLKDNWTQAFEQAGQPSSSFMRTIIDTYVDQLNAFWVKWFDQDAPPVGFEQDKELGIVWSVLDFMLIVHRHHLELAPDDALRRHTCLEIASRIVDNIERLARTGGLAFLQDTAATMTSSLGVMLRKMYRPATRAQQALIIDLLRRILVAHTQVLADETDTAPAYVARFIRRLLGAINHQSRAESRAGSRIHSRAGSPTHADPVDRLLAGAAGDQTLLADDAAGPDSLPEFLKDLETFMQMPEHTVSGNGRDDLQYWAQLFSAGSTEYDATNANILDEMMFGWDPSAVQP